MNISELVFTKENVKVNNNNYIYYIFDSILSITHNEFYKIGSKIGNLNIILLLRQKLNI